MTEMLKSLGEFFLGLAALIGIVYKIAKDITKKK
jgi:hypothetical protein